MNKFVWAVALALAAIGCEKKEQQMTIPPRPAAQVTVAAAEARDVPIYLDEIGRTAGVETVTIQPQVTGKVTQIHVEYCSIRSPIDGRTGQHLIDVGNVVSSSGPNGGTNMLVIQRLEPIYSDFTIPEQHLAAVRQRMSDHTLKTQVWLPGEESN